MSEWLAGPVKTSIGSTNPNGCLNGLQLDFTFSSGDSSYTSGWFNPGDCCDCNIRITYTITFENGNPKIHFKYECQNKANPSNITVSDGSYAWLTNVSRDANGMFCGVFNVLNANFLPCCHTDPEQISLVINFGPCTGPGGG